MNYVEKERKKFKLENQVIVPKFQHQLKDLHDNLKQ